MDELTKEFGSGRMQRAVLQRQKNALDTDMLSAATKSVAETSIVNEEASGKANGRCWNKDYTLHLYSFYHFGILFLVLIFVLI